MRAFRIVLITTALLLAAAGPSVAGETTASEPARFTRALSESDFGPARESGGWQWRRLERDFVFVDAEGREWVAPAGAVVNGASIPGPLRRWFGEPWDWEAGYVEASVVHDVYCTEPYDRTVTSGAVHAMFYEACRANGVSRWRAGLMTAACYAFGPRWGEREVVTGAPPRKPEA